MGGLNKTSSQRTVGQTGMFCRFMLVYRVDLPRGPKYLIVIYPQNLFVKHPILCTWSLNLRLCIPINHGFGVKGLYCLGV